MTRHFTFNYQKRLIRKDSDEPFNFKPIQIFDYQPAAINSLFNSLS